MIELDIPGADTLRIAHLVCDFTGTLSFNGKLIPGVASRFHALSASVGIHVVTSDTFGVARDRLAGLPCNLHLLTGDRHDEQKRAFVEERGAESVCAVGNGANDRLMLAAAALGIAVIEAEGCATSALQAADVIVRSPVEAFDLLLHPLRLKATLRY